MRSKSFLIALPLVALIIAPSARAQDTDDVVFVQGTGESDSADAMPPADFADEDNQSEMLAMADKVADPAVQEGVASVVEQMAETMMRLPVGHFAEAIENARPGTVNKRIPRDATVADLAGRDTGNLPEELGDRSREVMGMMGGFARAMAVMLPEFERMGRQMEEGIREAKAQAKRN